MFKEFILENWALLLITAAFAIVLKTTIFIERRMIKRMYVLIALIFSLAVIVFIEFYLSARGMAGNIRLVLMAVRYSATPLIMAMILYTLVRRVRWSAFIPAAVFAVINFVSIPTGIVFSLGADGSLRRGPLGYLPYIAVGVYSVVLICAMYRNSTKQSSEVIPIVFMALSFLSGLILPFVLGRDYSKIFCTTIMIALFVYYVFSILQLTSKDPLTGLLNRQAYYAAVRDDPRSITGIVSIDMNGLKAINDRDGHTSGDRALGVLADCFMRARNDKQSVYRVGGDEFVILCRRSSENEIRQLIERIRGNLSGTGYSCSIGYSCSPDGARAAAEMLKESDKNMYADKEAYYLDNGIDKYRS